MKLNKKILLFGILPSVLIITSVLLTIPAQKELSNRENYEQFLASEYQKVPSFSEEEFKGMPKPTRPDLAGIQDYFNTLDPELGRVPTERLKEAYLQTKEIINENRMKSQTESIIWEGTDAEMGGRTRTIMYDPNIPNGNKVWAGAVTGGLWYNNDITNANSAWVTVDDFWGSISISKITYDPANPQIFYAGTGEVQTAYTNYRESSGVGMGVWRSTNGGDTWEHMESIEDFKYITDIAIREEDGNSVIYLGVASGYYHGQNQQSAPSDGLYRSTDNGDSWDQVLPDITGETEPYATSNIKIGADGRIYVGTIQNIEAKGGATILYSDDGTAGSWTVFEDYREIIENHYEYNLAGRVILACAPSDENIVYAFLAAGKNTGFNRYFGRYILKSVNKGETWVEIGKPDEGDWASLAWHALIGVVDPNDPNKLFAGGLDVWKTTNAGNIWNHLSDWALMYYGGGDDYVHADQHDYIYKSGSSDEMVFATDGGIFYTNNSSSSSPVFQERNKSFNSLQFYTCDITSIPGEEKYVGGLQDNGTLYYTGSPLSINDMIDGGDGASCFIDKDQPSIMITSVYYNRYTIFEDGNQINYIWAYQSGTFISPADYDYKENVIYANAVDFFGSYANDILRIKNITGSEIGEFIDLGTGISAYFSHIKYSPYSPTGTANLFIGSNSGRLYKAENAQAIPEVTEIGSPDFPTANISCIAIGGSEDTLLVTFSNYGVSSVWQTYDGGNSWFQKESNLPDMPIRWAIYHPQNSQQAMLATELGIWTTENLHESTPVWEPAINGLANVRVDMIKIRESDNTVLAATHGRGLFTATYKSVYTSIEENKITEISMNIYPNPSSDFINIELKNTDSKQLSISISDMSGRIVFQENVKTISSNYSKKIDVSAFAKGNYLLNIKSGNKRNTEKFVVN
ncbi:MAG: T9SS type A sorting domain-containing protein [Bacteroidales bacterium]|nr:T9SS type A sorting domain-containing protein [Bacteroidales bacterium]